MKKTIRLCEMKWPFSFAGFVETHMDLSNVNVRPGRESEIATETANRLLIELFLIANDPDYYGYSKPSLKIHNRSMTVKITPTNCFSLDDEVFIKCYVYFMVTKDSIIVTDLKFTDNDVNAVD